MNVLQLKDAVRMAPKCRSVRDNKHAIVEMLIQPAQNRAVRHGRSAGKLTVSEMPFKELETRLTVLA